MASRRIQTVRLEKDFLQDVKVVSGLWSFESEMFQVDPKDGKPGFFVPLYCEEGTQISLPRGRMRVYLKNSGENVDPAQFIGQHELSNYVVVLATNEKGLIEYSDVEKYPKGRILVA